MFAYGLNHDGQLGVDDTVDRATPTPLKAFALLKMLHERFIVQVVAGAEHSAALDDSGTVHTWGASRQGQLGVGAIHTTLVESVPRQLTPRPVLALHGVRIVQLASGGNHMLALSDAGAVYSWGCGKNGRLGHGSAKDEPQPRRVSSLGVRALAVACVRI